MLAERIFDSGEVVLHYLEGPDNGPSVIFLHGGGDSSLHWKKVLEKFYEEYYVVAPDLRGYGNSGRAKGAYKTKDSSHDIIELISKQIGQPSHVVGHSFGSMVGIQVAADIPSYIKSIVLEDPPLYIDVTKWMLFPMIERAIDLTMEVINSGRSEEDLNQELLKIPGLTNIQEFAHNLYRIDTEIWENLKDGSWREGFDTDMMLGRVKCPVLLLHGEEKLGSVLTLEDIKKAQKLLRNVTVIGFDGLGHGLHTQDSDKFSKIVKEFIKS
jgi:pimeloyl-ACP methyl ester carboxylesterase